MAEERTADSGFATRGWFWAPFLILCLAAIIRLPGVGWELPGNLHQFSYHPDELPLLGAATAIDPAGGQWNPQFYNYGTLYIYLLKIPIALASTSDGINLGLATLLGRLLTVLFGVGTVWACWLGGKKMAGHTGGAAAGMCMAVMPLHVQQSQFCTVDVPATFFVAMAIVMTLSERQGLAGLFAGLAAATKYTTGLVILVPLAAVLMLPNTQGRTKLLGVTLGLAIAGFLIGCPGAVLWPADFLHGISFEMAHAKAGHGLVFQNTGPGWIYHLIHSLLPGLGWPLLALVILALVSSIGHPDSRQKAMGVFLVVFYAAISLAAVRFARYTLPMFPAFAIFIAAMLRHNPQRHYVGGTIAVALLTLVYSLSLESQFTQPDPRTQAAAWLRDNLRAGAIVAMPTTPWFYSPPLSSMFGALSVKDRKQAAATVPGMKLIIPKIDWDADAVFEHRPTYVVLSYYETFDPLRLNDPAWRAFRNRLARDYELRTSFGRDPLSIKLFTLTSDLPHDMRYVSFPIEIYGQIGNR